MSISTYTVILFYLEFYDLVIRRNDLYFYFFQNLGGRAIIPVNPTLAERLCSMDIQFLIESGKDSKLRLHPQGGLTQDFFLLLAVCNTVIVAKHPHR